MRRWKSLVLSSKIKFNCAIIVPLSRYNHQRRLKKFIAIANLCRNSNGFVVKFAEKLVEKLSEKLGRKRKVFDRNLTQLKCCQTLQTWFQSFNGCNFALTWGSRGTLIDIFSLGKQHNSKKNNGWANKSCKGVKFPSARISHHERQRCARRVVEKSEAGASLCSFNEFKNTQKSVS